MTSTDEILKQIDRALALYDEAKRGSQHNDLSDLGGGVSHEIKTVIVTTVERLSAPGSPYRRDRDSRLLLHLSALRALRRDYADGYLDSVHALIRADVFADFLEMAAYLLQQAYKDAAAVIIGSVLEDHLRTMCTARGVSTVEADGRAKKADTMNADLARAGAYDKLDLKAVTAWLDLRNKAAHGEYKKYEQPQVDLMLAGVRDFIRRMR